MAFRRGDVVLVPFPYSNLTGIKVRPAVVVSSSMYHTMEPDLILAALTSKVTAATGPFDYVLSAWLQAGLRSPSAFKPVLFTLQPIRVIHSIGTLVQVDLVAIEQRLRRALDL